MIEPGQRWEPKDDCGGAVHPVIIEQVQGDALVVRNDHPSRLRVPMWRYQLLRDYRRTTNPAWN